MLMSSEVMSFLCLCYVADKMDTEMCKELGEFKVDLDGRFTSVRTRETNLGNVQCQIRYSTVYNQ